MEGILIQTIVLQLSPEFRHLNEGPLVCIAIDGLYKYDLPEKKQIKYATRIVNNRPEIYAHCFHTIMRRITSEKAKSILRNGVENKSILLT